jgi:hypothetical protein
LTALRAEFTAEVDRLAEVATRAVGGTAGGLVAGLEVLEPVIRTAMTALGARLLADLLSLDPGYRGPVADCGAGHRAQFVSYRDKSMDTVLGRVRLRRAYYHCRTCRAGVVPRDRELSVDGTGMSAGLRAMVAHTATAVPFARAAGMLAGLAGVTVSTSRVQRAAEAAGAAARAAVEAESAAILAGRVRPLPAPQASRPDGGGPDMLYIAIDGTGVPMRPTETAGRAGKHPDGRARTREVKLAALFTQTHPDQAGRPVRDPGSTTYLASFDPAEPFGALVAAEAQRRGADRIRQLVVLGDGATWIWKLAGTRFPEATQIVDLYHAREHLHDLADHLAFIVADPDTWPAQRLADLDNGDIEAITRAARVYPLVATKASELDTKLGYFTTNAHRMRYAHYRDLGMFIGSGTVEAGCKNVIGARLKQSGMRWTLPGADAITHLRCQDASGRFDQIWPMIHNQTATA